MAKRKGSFGMSGANKRTKTQANKRRTGGFNVAASSSLTRSPPTYRFMRYSSAQSSIACSTGETSFVTGFSLDQVQGFGELTVLFDQFRISKVEIFFHLQTNPDSDLQLNGTLTNGANYYPKMWYVGDVDDLTSISKAQIREYSGARNTILKADKAFKITVKPSVLVQTYQTALQAGYSSKRNVWVDSNSVSVPHYGLKCLIDLEGQTPSQPFYIKVDYRYYLEMRGVH